MSGDSNLGQGSFGGASSCFAGSIFDDDEPLGGLGSSRLRAGVAFDVQPVAPEDCDIGWAAGATPGRTCGKLTKGRASGAASAGGRTPTWCICK